MRIFNAFSHVSFCALIMYLRLILHLAVIESQVRSPDFTTDPSSRRLKSAAQMERVQGCQVSGSRLKATSFRGASLREILSLINPYIVKLLVLFLLL